MTDPMLVNRERELDGVAVPASRARCASSWLLPLAAMLLSIPVLVGVVGGLKLMTGLSLRGSDVLLAVTVAAAGLAIWLRRIHGSRWWVAWMTIIAAAAMTILSSAALAEWVLDGTWDGQWFHQEAVIQLADGWNPFRTALTDAEVPHEGARARINGYAKATWLWGAQVYLLTDRIETAKVFSLSLMVAAGFAVLACLLIITRLRPLTAIIVAAAAAANPVAMVQFLNSYQDGALASMLTICAASLALWVVSGSRIGLAMATAAGVAASAIKLTGPFYVAILVLAAVGWLVWNGRWSRERRVLAIAVGVAVVGLHAVSGGTYLTNSVRYHHPLYPVMGPEKAPIVETPPHHRLQVLVASVFSRSQPGQDDYKTVERLSQWRGLKVPFFVDVGELSAFMSPWVRVGGWGPLFGGIVLLTVALLAVAALRHSKQLGIILLVALPLVVTVVVNPACWKARFVPQLWLVPLVIVVMVLTMSKGGVERALAIAILVAAVANSALVTWGHIPAAVAVSDQLRTRLLALDDEDRPVRVDFGPFRANRVLLAELGVDFTEVEDERCSLPVYSGFASAKIVRSEVSRLSDGGRAVAMRWQPTPGATSYRVAAIDGADGGAVRPPFRLETTVPEAVVPVGPHRTTVTLEICNDLGCSPPKTLRVVAGVE